MIGSWKWNLMISLAGTFLTFVLNIQANPLMTTLTRCVYSFLILFLIAFILRWFLGTVAGLKTIGETPMKPANQQHKGAQVDYLTPDSSDDLSDLLKQQLRNADSQGVEAFEPLKPPKLVKTQDMDPEELAKALRHMSEE